MILGDIGELRTSSGLFEDFNRIFKFYFKELGTDCLGLVRDVTEYHNIY